MLLIYTFKKAFKGSHSLQLLDGIKKLVFKIKYVLPFLLLSNTGLDNSVGEVENISFSIIKNESSIGFINIEKASINQTTTYTINSEVNAKFIFNFNAIGREKSIYSSDTLIYSSVYRKLNNKVKLDQSLSLINGTYFLDVKKKKEVLQFDVINRNLATLFFIEPKDIQEVYSDKYKEMVKITPIGKGKYKIILPDKGTNIYHYENGKCKMIEIEGSFFKVKLIPNS